MSGQFAIILGSGCGELAGDGDGQAIETRFGAPSSPVRELRLNDRIVRVLSRHGDAHTIPPHRINYRANLAALKAAGVEAVIGLNTVGVITALRRPGELAVPDQLIDYTWGREHTIHETIAENVGHVDLTDPFAEPLRRALLEAAAVAGIDCYDGGVYAVTQGPRLETAAEIDRLERDGADFVGMTAMPEAALARELNLDYACLALVVNHAAGRGEKPIHDDVESSILSARTQAVKLLQHFFGATH